MLLYHRNVVGKLLLVLGTCKYRTNFCLSCSSLIALTKSSPFHSNALC